jgi:hypothetical protein
MRTAPVNQSAGPLLEGCEPLLLISIFKFFHCFRRLTAFADWSVMFARNRPVFVWPSRFQSFLDLSS